MARFFSDPQGGCCGEVQLYVNLGSVLELHFMLNNFTIEEKNLSLETGVVPTECKMAKVIPIFKSGSIAEIDNYRPISIP